jgi:hypothetical protein
MAQSLPISLEVANQAVVAAVPRVPSTLIISTGGSTLHVDLTVIVIVIITTVVTITRTSGRKYQQLTSFLRALLEVEATVKESSNFNTP